MKYTGGIDMIKELFKKYTELEMTVAITMVLILIIALHRTISGHEAYIINQFLLVFFILGVGLKLHLNQSKILKKLEGDSK